MDSFAHLTLSEKDIIVGRNYASSLKKLALFPDLLAWGHISSWDPEGIYAEGDIKFEKQMILMTSMVDAVGANALYELLFIAHDAAVTPRDLDPFSVTLISPDSLTGISVISVLSSPETLRRISAPDHPVTLAAAGSKPVMHMAVSPQTGTAIVIPENAIYAFRAKRFAKTDRVRRFETFQRKVMAAAA